MDAALGSSSVASVAASSLGVGSYTFWLNVSAGSRTAATSTVVQVVSGSPPSVAAATLMQTKYNTDAGFLSLSARARRAATTKWSAASSDVSDVFKKKSTAASGILNQGEATVVLSLLTAGNTYTFRFTASKGRGAAASSAYSHVSVTMNEAPASGRLDVAPRAGWALATAFAFSATNWEDEDLPLTYIFGSALEFPVPALPLFKAFLFTHAPLFF